MKALHWSKSAARMTAVARVRLTSALNAFILLLR